MTTVLWRGRAHMLHGWSHTRWLVANVLYEHRRVGGDECGDATQEAGHQGFDQFIKSLFLGSLHYTFSAL